MKKKFKSFIIIFLYSTNCSKKFIMMLKLLLFDEIFHIKHIFYVLITIITNKIN